MRAYFNIERPEGAELTLRLTLTVKEWREITDKLPDDGTTAGAFCKVIKSMAATALKQVDSYYVSTGWDTRAVEADDDNAPALAKPGAA